MIDAIKIYFSSKEFRGNLNNCVLQERKEDRTEWRLYNPIHRSHLSVWKYNNGVITIKGSLRKWYFGNNSIKDLTLGTFVEATKHIAERLGMTWEQLCNAKISQVELGLNIPISIPFSVLNKKIVSYGTHRKSNVMGKGRTQGNYGTIYFGEKHKNNRKHNDEHDCDFRLKIYDKCKEIEDKRDFTDDEILPDANIMRIEFTIDDKDTFKRKGLPQISNMNGLMDNWQSLYELWATEVGRITIISNISDSNGLEIDDILCAETLNLFPWKDNIQMFEEYITTHYKTKASINNARSALYKRINNLLDNHSNLDEYRKINLYKDITRYLLDRKSIGEIINIPLMIALLHSSTHYLGYE